MHVCVFIIHHTNSLFWTKRTKARIGQKEEEDEYKLAFRYKPDFSK